jgi:hypothetical protein
MDMEVIRLGKTAVIEGRVDMRDLASCADYFIKQGMPAANKSDLMFRVLTTFAHAAVEQGARRFESTEEALGYMFEIGLGPVNRLKLEGRRANNFTLSRAITEERGLEPDNSDLVRRAMAIMEGQVDADLSISQRAEQIAERDATDKERMDEFLRSMNVAKSGG